MRPCAVNTETPHDSFIVKVTNFAEMVRKVDKGNLPAMLEKTVGVARTLQELDHGEMAGTCLPSFRGLGEG